MIKEFREFIMRGNVMDMAVGIVIGLAFGKIITSFVNDILMPPIGLLLGKADFSSLFINLSGTPYASLAEAQAAGAPTVNYGLFISTIVDFLIIAFAIFIIIRQLNRLSRKKAEAPPPPDAKPCQYCLSTISIKATRCPHCTSQLNAEQT